MMIQMVFNPFNQPHNVNNNTPPALNPSTPKSDQHLSSPYNISSESLIKVQNKRNDQIRIEALDC